MRLRVTERALADIDRISGYIRDRNPSAADRVRAALRSGIQLVAAHPYANRALRRGVRRRPLSRYPYIIFYEVDEAAQEVRILTVRHAARRPIA